MAFFMGDFSVAYSIGPFGIARLHWSESGNPEPKVLSRPDDSSD